MKILLDENFPLPLYQKLRQQGFDAEHVIALDQRGMTDARIRARLRTEELLFLTNDTEFERLEPDHRGQVIISRLPQRLPIAERVEIWMRALRRFLRHAPQGKLFDLMPDGRVVGWKEGRDGRTPTID